VWQPNRVYVDHGLTGTNRERPGLREALAACREGDTLVVTKLDRLARSLPDARAIADELTVRQVRLNLGGSVYDPTDPVGRLLFNVLAMVAEFESDLFGVARSTVYRASESLGPDRDSTVGRFGSAFVVIPTGSNANLVVSGPVDEAVLVCDAS